MNLLKSIDYFDPDAVKDRIHIIGCGSVGSTLAEHLARYGLSNFVLYDFDVVEDKNIVNQMFDLRDVGRPKVDAVADKLKSINADVKVRTVKTGWNEDMTLSGYVFLCVDSIAVRKAVVEANKYNSLIKGMFDFRTGLVEADHFACAWQSANEIKWLLSTMNFTDEEAEAHNPVTACGITIGVAATVRLIVDVGVCNFIQNVKGNGLKKMITVNTETINVFAQ